MNEYKIFTKATVSGYFTDKSFVGVDIVEAHNAQEVRKKWHKEKWYFSVSDVVQILTDSKDVKQYVKKLRQRDTELSSYWGTICTPLELISKDGKKRKETTTDTKLIIVTLVFPQMVISSWWGATSNQ